MKCFNCGKETEKYLCDNCQTVDILDKIFDQLHFYKADTCENPYIIEYASTLDEGSYIRDCMIDILKPFPDDVTEYYKCVFYGMRNMDEFESATEAYLSKHDWKEKKSQHLIYYLLKKYVRNDFIKPRKWCDWIAQSKGIYCELYLMSATYYGMIAEYDLSDQMVDKGLCCEKFLYCSKEYIYEKLNQQKMDTLRYRTKKPYWPTTEERRRAVAMYYDEKGITYPRIETKPQKIQESDFEPLSECFDAPNSYCSFWCSDSYSMVSAKSIYQIAAIKVENGIITKKFQNYIRPWDGIQSRKSAAKKANVDISVIESAEDVDQVMKKFFDFVDEYILMSTDALGVQARLISRAARYAGMNHIKNKFFDLLDFASDIDREFDFKNNNREYLLRTFSIAEGSDSLEKAMANINIYNSLCKYGK